jgi:hypothetical protein
MAATGYNCTVPDAKTFLLDLVGAPIKGAPSSLLTGDNRTVPDAKSSLLDLAGAPVK